MGWFRSFKKLYKKGQELTGMETEVIPQDSGIPVSSEPVQPPQQGVDQIGPETVHTVHSGIQTTLASWKGGKRYYLQLMGVPSDPTGDTFLTGMGYKYNQKYRTWSKEVNLNNAHEIEVELDTIENNYNVPVFRDALQDIDTIFNLSEETVKSEEATNIQKLKGEQIDGKEKYKIAEEYVQQSLEKIVENINTPETQAFLDALTNLNDKFHQYSLVNSFLIAWQNGYIDPATGKMKRRSGRVASKGKWEKELGRQVKPEEIMKGSDVFVPRISDIKSSGISVLIGAIRGYLAWKGDGDFQSNIAPLYGFLKSKMKKNGQKWKKGMISTGLYGFFSEEINKNRPHFNTIGDVLDHFIGKQAEGEAGDVVQKILTGFQMGPVYDMDQTEVIPGQEHKDPKVQIEAVEQQ